MSFVCRTCLQQTTESNYINLNANSTESVRIRDNLAYCIPEIAIDLVTDPIMCIYCATSLTLAFNFKHQCLQSEERISSYVGSKQTNSNSVNLSELYHILNDVKPACDYIKTVSNLSSEVEADESYLLNAADFKVVTEENDLCRNKEYARHEIEEGDFKPSVLLESARSSEILHNQNEDHDISVDCIKREDERSNNMYANEKNNKMQDSSGLENDEKDDGGLESVRSNDRLEHKQNSVYNRSNTDMRSRPNCHTKPFKSKQWVCKTSKLNTLQERKDNDRTHSKQKLNIRRHNIEEKSFQCNKCKYTTKIRGYLVRHIRRTHNRERTFKCEACHKNFTEKNNLNMHRKIHTGEKLFKCGVCDNKFTRKGDLQKHMKIHTGEKSFTCHVCYKEFSHKSNLNAHMKIHTGEKLFKCEVCNNKFTYKCNLERHMRVHSGLKRFNSEICGDKIDDADSFDGALQIRTGVKPYKCEVFIVQPW